MNKQEYVAQTLSVIAAATGRSLRTLDTAREAVIAATTTGITGDELQARHAAVKSASNRVRENEALARFMNSEELASLCFVHKFDFEVLTSERTADSRECKKRFGIIMTALSVKNADALGKAEFAYFSALASGRLADSHTLAQAQSAMKHQTTTQARYMRSFLNYFKASKSSDTASIVVDRDSATMRKILSLFA